MLQTETFSVYALFQLKYIPLQLYFTVELSVKGINLSASEQH